MNGLGITAVALAVAEGITPSAAALYQPHLPPGRAAAIMTALQELDLADEATIPAVTFVSAESSAATGRPIINHIRQWRHGSLDLWLMRQRQSQEDGDDPRRWSHVGLIVDRGTQPAQATFLEFAPEPVATGLPRPITPRVPCLRCHPNGPRAMRPEPTMPLGAGERRIVAHWNDAITKDGVIATHVPSDPTLARALRPMLPGAGTPLLLAACRDCHDDAGTARALRMTVPRCMPWRARTSA